MEDLRCSSFRFLHSTGSSHGWRQSLLELPFMRIVQLTSLQSVLNRAVVILCMSVKLFIANSNGRSIEWSLSSSISIADSSVASLFGGFCTYLYRIYMYLCLTLLLRSISALNWTELGFVLCCAVLCCTGARQRRSLACRVRCWSCRDRETDSLPCKGKLPPYTPSILLYFIRLILCATKRPVSGFAPPLCYNVAPLSIFYKGTTTTRSIEQEWDTHHRKSWAPGKFIIPHSI